MVQPVLSQKYFIEHNIVKTLKIILQGLEKNDKLQNFNNQYVITSPII